MANKKDTPTTAKKSGEKITWTTAKRKVKDLIPYEFNPRVMTKDQVEQLTKSLEKFGLVEIPVINTDNIIAAGHQRVAIMMQQGRGEEEIDVRVPSRTLTEAEFKEYLIRSNKNRGSWDFDLLGNHFEMGDLMEFGFNESILDLTGASTKDKASVKKTGAERTGVVIFEASMLPENREKLFTCLKEMKDKYGYLTTEECLLDMVDRVNNPQRYVEQ